MSLKDFSKFFRVVQLSCVRYSKSRLKTLRAMGFSDDEIIFRRCQKCSAKVMLDPSSLDEWEGINVLILCTECVDLGETNEPSRFIGMTRRAVERCLKAQAHIRSN
jgi:hypothetical protein